MTSSMLGNIISAILLLSGLLAVWIKTKVDIAKIYVLQSQHEKNLDEHKQETKEQIKEAKETNEKSISIIRSDIKDLGNNVFAKLDTITLHFIECQK